MNDILIVGTGALATLFAARLAAAGIHVTLLGSWSSAIETLNRDGAKVLQPDGSQLQSPVRAVVDPAECANASLALVLVKAWQTARAAQQLGECMRADGLVVSLQNGLGNREILSERLGPERVLLGATTTGATLLGPGLVRMAGEGAISLGEHLRSSEVRDLFLRAGFRCEIVPDAEAVVWGKLVINAAVNPVTALLGVTNGAILENAEARHLAAALAGEAAAVAAAQGIRLPFAHPQQAVEDVLRATGANRSSMLQDVMRGVPTEIDAICGLIARLGAEYGVPAPVNWTMWQLLSALRPGK